MCLEHPEFKYQRTNLDNLQSSTEEDGTLETVDPLDLLGLGGLLSMTMGFLRGTLAVVAILVKWHAFPTIVKVLPVGCDPLALVGRVTSVEDNIDDVVLQPVSFDGRHFGLRTIHQSEIDQMN
nr:hypothetical protein [Tanacetum cinerariifolium]